MIYFTADLHFGHDNIRTYCDRPFKTVRGMDEAMIERWNHIVTYEDDIYVLGDFTLGNFDKFKGYADRLAGKHIYMLPGNHDKRWFKYISRMPYRFVKLPEIHMLRLPQYKMDEGYSLRIVLCHYAMRVWEHSHHNSLHLFGHSHGTLTHISPRSMDVGVDSHNLYPVALPAIVEQLRREQ